MYIRRTSLLLAILFAASISFAQSYADNATSSSKFGAKAVFTSNKVSKKITKPKPVRTQRFHKRLSGTFTGFAIELAAADLPLTRNHKVLRQYGNVHYDKLRAGGYSYVIKTEFNSKTSLKKFYETVILPKNAKAKMVEYKLGKRNIL